MELFNHIGKLYKEDKTLFAPEKLSTESETFSNTIINDHSKPFGEHGEVTLNQIGVALKSNLKDVNWDFVYDATQVTVHGLPLAIHAVSYGVILRSFMKHIHNRPMLPNLNPTQLADARLLRNKQLALFTLFGAPLTLLFLKFSAIGFKDVLTFSYSGGSGAQIENNNSNMINTTTNSSFFILLNNFKKKIPNWLKIVFKLLFTIILVLKLLGFSFIPGFISVLYFVNNLYHMKLFYYISCSLIISHNLLSLYLIHKFSNNKIKISEALPDFLINWLKIIENMGSSKAGIKEFKSTCYIDITIYLTLLILMTLFL
jgi:hypothetical protein